MMKSVFSLLVLLHCCSTYNVNPSLNGEIIRGLEALNKLYTDKKVNITPPVVHGPKMVTSTHPSFCVSAFAAELKHLLHNVTILKENKTVLENLEGNLRYLDRHLQNNPKCQMAPVQKAGKKPFQPYINFFRQLNYSKKI
ncbi:hypothetical protein FQN60_010469 [Etheostoma spectabile]|uniref:Interleukin-4 n=1 Tax=Etheostoma spectabile TaxID=54343 RepID=A0A5J5D6X1_9PERO|nr:hypothetical protein FQN60_010469 [Etheostoma spectabile]